MDLLTKYVRERSKPKVGMASGYNVDEAIQNIQKNIYVDCSKVHGSFKNVWNSNVMRRPYYSHGVY